MEYMQITRTELPTGGPLRTPREEIAPLVQAEVMDPLDIEAEPEWLVDVSPSVGFWWQSDPKTCTWYVQRAMMQGLLGPFAAMDSQAAAEAGTGKGGIATFPFSHEHFPIDPDPEQCDLSLENWDRKLAAFYQRFFHGADRPDQYGGTEIMTAVTAADGHFRDEFVATRPFAKRPLRVRTVFTDGDMQDEDAFIRYLEQATAHQPSPDRHPGLTWGQHGEWLELWAVAILGEDADGKGKSAYNQYQRLRQRFPWIYSYFFQGVKNGGEIAEDMAVATVPSA